MKKFLSLISLATISLAVLAQSPIPNGGLENWNTNVPTSWGTIDPIFSQFNINTGLVTREQNAANVAQGTSSMKLKTDSVTIPLIGQTLLVPGVAVCGSLGFSLATQSPSLAGHAYTSRPDSVQFKYKYVPGSAAGDTGLVVVRLTKWDNNTRTTVEVGNVLYSILRSPNFSTAKLKVNYTSAMAPDTMQIIVVSSAPGGGGIFGGGGGGGGFGGGVGVKGTNLWVDDFQFSGLDTVFKAYINPTADISLCQGDSTTFRTDNINGVTLQWFNGATAINGATNYIFKTAAPGNYYVRATKNGINYYSDTVVVTVNPKPVVTFNGLPDSVCLNASPITLTGGTPAGGIYTGQGVIQGTFNPNLAGTGTKTITYTYTNQTTGCRNSASETIVVYVCPNSIELLSKDVQLSVYPNPASTQLHIEGNSKIVGSTIMVYNTNGQIVATEKVASEKATLDVKSFTTGTYILRLVDAKNNDIARSSFQVVN